jgi:hypothetical protein
MSLEQVLLIVFIVVLPLLQYLMQLMRQARRRNELPERPQSLPPSEQRPPIRKLEPPPATEDRSRPDARTTTERKSPRTADEPLAGTILRSARPGMAAMGLYDPRHLRRGIVLMMILEPCRAIHPYE